MMPKLMKAVNADGVGCIKDVTTVRTICDIISDNSITRTMFSEVYQLMQLYLTVPMTTATAECTFSMQELFMEQNDTRTPK